MNNYTKEDIIRLVEEEDVEFIRLQFTDLFGNLKNIAVTASQLDRVLSNKCMFDGSAIDGFARIEESDMYLYPDLSTLEIFPWRPQQGKVARMICDVYRPNGQPFEGDPRYVLKRAVQQAEDMGYTFEVGPECEFFLFNTDENTMPTTNTHEQAAIPAQARVMAPDVPQEYARADTRQRRGYQSVLHLARPVSAPRVGKSSQ